MDERLRTLERTRGEGPEARARLLRERLRAGSLPPERLRLAAALGEPSARAALGEPPPRCESVGELLALAASVDPAGPVLVATVAAREAVQRHEAWLGEALPLVGVALREAEAWAACPCEAHRAAAQLALEGLGPVPRQRPMPYAVVRPRVQAELAARRALLAAAARTAAERAAAALAAAEAAELALAAADELGVRRGRQAATRALALLEVRPRLQAWALGEGQVPPAPPGPLDLAEAELATQGDALAVGLLELVRRLRRGQGQALELRELLHLGVPAPPALLSAIGRPGGDWLTGLGTAHGVRARAAIAAVLPMQPGAAGRAALQAAARALRAPGPRVGRGQVALHDAAIAAPAAADRAAGFAARLAWDGGGRAAAGLRAALRAGGVADEEARARARAAFLAWRLEGLDPLEALGDDGTEPGAASGGAA